MVKDTWDQLFMAEDNLIDNLKKLGRTLQCWNKDSFGNENHNISQLKRELNPSRNYLEMIQQLQERMN